MQDEIDTLSELIDEINEELRIIHLREAVFKSRLQQAVHRKCMLVEERRVRSQQAANIRESASNTSSSRNTGATTPEPEQHDSTNNDISGNNGSNRSSSRNNSERISGRNESSSRTTDDFRENRARRSSKLKDRDGVSIEIGDEVRFLTKGVNKSEFGEVHKITKKFVFCVDNNDELTKRYPRNLRIVSKYHEC